MSASNRLLSSVDVYARLNAACRAPGSKTELARRAGLSRQFVDAVERGIKCPSPALLAALGLRRVVAFEEIEDG